LVRIGGVGSDARRAGHGGDDGDGGDSEMKATNLELLRFVRLL